PETTWDDAARTRRPHPNDEAMRTYTERYVYDAVGNFIEMIHQATGGSWTRSYTYDEPSAIEPARMCNRLSATTVGSLTTTYAHDVDGNMTAMPHLPLMVWDFEDQLQASARQVVSGGATPETTYYVYDASGT